MIVKCLKTGKYMLISDTNNYYGSIIREQYGIHIHMNKQDQVSLIQNNLKRRFIKNFK